MNDPFVIFWAIMVFGSIAWYAFLVVYIGLKAGREILAMTAALDAAERARLRAVQETTQSNL